MESKKNYKILLCNVMCVKEILQCTQTDLRGHRIDPTRGLVGSAPALHEPTWRHW